MTGIKRLPDIEPTQTYLWWTNSTINQGWIPSPATFFRRSEITWGLSRQLEDQHEYDCLREQLWAIKQGVGMYDPNA